MNNNYGTCIYLHVPTCWKTMRHFFKSPSSSMGSEDLQFSSIAALDAGKSFAAASCGGIDGLPGRCRELSTSGGGVNGAHFRGDIHTIYIQSITYLPTWFYMYIFEMYNILYISVGRKNHDNMPDQDWVPKTNHRSGTAIHTSINYRVKILGSVYQF